MKVTCRSPRGCIIADVDKERFIVLKEDPYDRSSRQYEQCTVLDVKQIGQVWMATNVTMNYFAKRRIATSAQPVVALNVDINEEFLSQRSLTDFAYRERNMQIYRKFLPQEQARTQPEPSKP